LHRTTAKRTGSPPNAPRLVVEQLRDYAHDLNPVEFVWGTVKAKEFANHCPTPLVKQRLLLTPH
jgi:transposase